MKMTKEQQLEVAIKSVFLLFNKLQTLEDKVSKKVSEVKLNDELRSDIYKIKSDAQNLINFLSY